MRLSEDVRRVPALLIRAIPLPDCFALPDGVTASTIPEGGTMQHPESKILNEYVMHMCESGWADEEATTEQGKAFLFRGNLVDDHLTFFFGLSQDEVSTLSDARGAIARMGPGIAIELYGDATVLEEQWRRFAR